VKILEIYYYEIVPSVPVACQKQVVQDQMAQEAAWNEVWHLDVAL